MAVNIQHGLFGTNDDVALVRAGERWVGLRRGWWLNPFRWLDEVDLLDKGGNYSFFHDLLVERPTEFRAFLYLFVQSCNNLDAQRLVMTQRQGEAVRLAREAMQAGVHPTGYVAQMMRITPRSVQRLLKRGSVALGEFFHVVDDDCTRIRWKPSDGQIRAQMAATRKLCAGHGTPGCGGSTSGKFALCWNCHRTYGIRGEWGERHRKWLEPEIRRIENDHRQAAINALYEEHGTFAGDYDDIGMSETA